MNNNINKYINKYIDAYLDEVGNIIDRIDRKSIKEASKILIDLRKRKGRLFILGIGGSAANASHAVNDFRKISKIETYAPTDNVGELTAWTNDVGFSCIFTEWLKESNFSKKDALLILSVGGGNKNTSVNLV